MTSQAQAVFTNKAFSFLGEECEKRVKAILRSHGVDFNTYLGNFLSDVTKIPFKRVYSFFSKNG
jgi:hypothetical protein